MTTNSEYMKIEKARRRNDRIRTVVTYVLLGFWALIVLWMVFPPAGLVATIVTLIRRTSINRNPSSAVGVLTIFMIFWLVIVLTAIVY